MTLKSFKFREIHFYQVAFIVLFIFVLSSKEDHYFTKGDERAHLSNVPILLEHGIGRHYLENYYGLAGPVYPLMQYALFPVTKLRPHLVRSVNMLCLLACIYFIGLLIGSASIPWFIMSIPMTYISGGYAMTIIPSLFFLIPSFILAIRDRPSRWLSLVYLASGLLLALAILTRLNLLVLLPLWLMLPFLKSKKNSWHAMRESGFLLLGAAPLLYWVFSIWNGVIPPVAASDIGGSAHQLISGFAWRHVILNIGIAGLIYLLLNRFWFDQMEVKQFKFVWIPAVLLLGSNYLFNILNFVPAQALFLQLGWSTEVLYLLGSIVGGGLMSLVGYFLWSAWMYYRKNSQLECRVSMTAILLILVSTGFASEIFSTRYAYQAIPFIFLTAGIVQTSDRLNTGLRILGTLMGLVMYFAFRNYQPMTQIVF